MNNIKKSLSALGIAIGTLGFVGAISAAEVIYFNDFDGGTMGPHNVGVGANGVGHTASLRYDNQGTYTGFRNNDANWNIHAKSNSAAPTVSASMSGNVVGHSGTNFYQNIEQSIYTFQVSGLSKYKDLKLMFDYAGELRNDNDDAASLSAYAGNTLNKTAIGDASYTLLTPTSGFGYTAIDGDDGIASPNDQYIDSRLDNAQFGDADIVDGDNPHEYDVGDTMGWNASGCNSGGTGTCLGESGVAMFDISGFGNADTINFRLAFGSNSTGTSGGVNFDNFKLTGVCINPGPDGKCDGGDTPVPEPATLSLAMLGIAAAYRRKKASKA